MRLLDSALLHLRRDARPGQPAAIHDPAVLALAHASQAALDGLTRRVEALERGAAHAHGEKPA